MLDTTDLTIDSGAILKLGGDEKIGSLFGAGSLQNAGGRLTVDDGNFAGVISGTGGLTKASTGDLVLSGHNTYTGSTLANAGTLEVAGSLTSNSIVTASGATLTADAGCSITTGVLTINGKLIVPDSSSLNYTTLTGSGIVDSLGSVFVNRAGATIRGYLSFSGNFTNLGTFAPGNSPGLTTIPGNYIEPGTLQVELENATPITGYDQVRVGGSVTIQSTSSLVVQTDNNVLPVRGTIYQVIANSTGGNKAVTGVFGSVLFDADGALGPGAPVVNAAVVFDQATGRVIATGLNGATSTFADLGNSSSQRSAASALFASATGPVGPNQINTTSTAGSVAFRLLTANGGSSGNLARFVPEHYGALADYAYGNDLAVTNLLHDRVSTLTNLLGTMDQGFAFYSGVMQQQADTADHADLARTDFYLGGDYSATKDLSIGLLVTHNNGDISAPYGSGDVDGTAVDAYFKQSFNPRLCLVGRLGYGTYNYDLRRSTTDTVQARGETDSSVFTASLGVSYVGWTWGELSLAPRFDLTYSQATVDGFTETGANDRLKLGSYDASHLIAQLGTSLVWATKIAGHNFSAELDLGIAQSLMQQSDRQHAAMVNDESVQFDQTFADDDATSFAYGLRLGYSVSDNVATLGTDGPHLVNPWNSYLKISQEGRLLIPAGYMHKTEANITHNPDVLITLGSSKVEGLHGPGAGFLIKGKARFVTSGPDFDFMKAKFSWLRATLAVTIETATQTW